MADARGGCDDRFIGSIFEMLALETLEPRLLLAADLVYSEGTPPGSFDPDDIAAYVAGLLSTNFTLRAESDNGDFFWRLYATGTDLVPFSETLTLSYQITQAGDLDVNITRDDHGLNDVVLGLGLIDFIGDRLTVEMDSLTVLNGQFSGTPIDIKFAGGKDIDLGEIIGVEIPSPLDILNDQVVLVGTGAGGTIERDVTVQSSSDIADRSDNPDAAATSAVVTLDGDLTIKSDSKIVFGTGSALSASNISLLAENAGEPLVKGILANAAAEVTLDGATLAAAGGTVTISALGKVDMTGANAEDGDQFFGNTLAGTVVTSFSTATVDIIGNTNITANTLDVTAAVDADIEASVEGATVKILTVWAAGDARVNIGDDSGTTTINVTGELTAEAKSDVNIKATSKPGTGDNDSSVDAAIVNVAAGLNFTDLEVNASLSGAALNLQTPIVNVTAAENAGSTFTAEAKSGAGSENVGIAGALAINVPKTSVQALIAADTTANFGGNDVKLEANSTTSTVTKALPKEATTGGSTGIGASVAFVYADNDTRAAIEEGATLNSTGDVHVSATGTHKVQTQADGGAAGGTAITPVVATSVPINDTVAEILGGPQLVVGSLTVQATQTTETSTVAKGDAKGSNAAIGVSIGLNIAEDTVVAQLHRDVDANGAVSVTASGASASTADARASSTGTQQDGESGQNVNQQGQSQVDHANTQVANNNGGTGTQTNTAPNSDTSSGAVSVAAAITFNITTIDVSALIAGTTATPLAIDSEGALTVKSSANTDANAVADGSAKTTSSGTSVGAAVAVNAAETFNNAFIADASVAADGVTVEAVMTERKLDIDTLTTVDLDGNTIFVGDAQGLTTGEKVVYRNGGGSNIGGLTDGTDYFVITDSRGKIKLATSAANATAGTAVDLTSLGSGDSHKLERPDTAADDDITFDPDKLRLDIKGVGLNTGDAVVYDNGGGTDIGGLTHDTTYFAIVNGDLPVKLAETRDKAYKGQSIDITGAGTGDDHKLKEATHSMRAEAKAGAGGGKFGIAGSVAINLGQGETAARLDSGTTVISEDGTADGDTDIGDVKIASAATTNNLAVALPNQDAAGTSLGFGLSFSFNLGAHDTRATIAGDADVADANHVAVTATADHAMFTHSKAGAEVAGDSTAITGAIALAVANNTTAAEVLAGNVLAVNGNLQIEATSKQQQRTVGDADTKGGQTGIGVAFAMGWVEDKTDALLTRDVSTGGATADNVKVLATSTTESTTIATGSAEGSKGESEGGNTADQETQNQTNFANNRAGTNVSSPNAGSQVDSANATAGSQTNNPGGQGGNAQNSSTETQGGYCPCGGGDRGHRTAAGCDCHDRGRGGHPGPGRRGGQGDQRGRRQHAGNRPCLRGRRQDDRRGGGRHQCRPTGGNRLCRQRHDHGGLAQSGSGHAA